MPKIKKQHKGKERSYGRLYPRLFLAAAGLGGVLLLFSSLPWILQAVSMQGQNFLYEAGFRVREVQVEGRARTPRQDLLRILSVRRGDFLFQHDPKKLQKDIEDLPWVYSCIVERRLPRVFSIRIAERKPLAIWQWEGRNLLIDVEGSVIPCPSREYPPDLLMVVGKEAPQQAAHLLEILNRFPKMKEQVIAAAWLRSGRWDLHLKGKRLLQLPSQNIEDALKRFCALENVTAFQDGNFERIDMRSPSRLILRPRPSPSTQQRV